MNTPPNFQLAALLFLQLAMILACCRAVGSLARRCGQPHVIGEMVAGVALGPSLFGFVAPTLHAQLFPPHSMGPLYCLSQVGLVLYMFMVGVDFRVDVMRHRWRSALSVSIAGIVAPLALGAGVAVYLSRATDAFAPNVPLGSAMLYLGAAMSITAFPVLARIIYEKGLAGSPIGILLLAAGSIGDAAAWCLLAVVLASLSGNAFLAVAAIAGGVLYALLVFALGRPLFRGLEARVQHEGRLPESIFVGVLILVLLGAWVTDAVGIYSVFGAFVMGAAVPPGSLAKELQRVLEPLTVSIFLPLYFVYSGLNTRIGLVNSPFLLAVAAVILLVACLGKGVACWMAARLNGEGERESIAIGALMNARGLMELVILNIGLERGIITPTLFSIMVIMTIVTTLMATPVFDLVWRRSFAPVRAAGARAA